MSGAVLLAWANLRRRWVTLVVIGFLAGIVGATVVGTAVVARRGATAYDRLLAVTRPADAVVGFYGEERDVGSVSQLPDVDTSWPFRVVVGRVAGEQITYRSVLSGPPAPAGQFGLLLDRGRLPRAADEVLVNTAVPWPIPVGSRLDIDLLTQDDFDSFSTGFGNPHGERVTLHVVGIGRAPGVDPDASSLIAGPEFFHRYAGRAGGADSVALRLHDGVAAADRVEQQLVAMVPIHPDAPAGFEPFHFSSRADEERSVARAASVAGWGLAALAAVAGLAGLVILLQAAARYSAMNRDEQQTQTAFGATSAQRLAALVGPGLLSAVVAATLTVLGGALAGLLGPIGAVRRYEPHPGLAVNVAIVAVGAAATAAFCLTCLTVTAFRQTRRASWGTRQRRMEPSAVASGLLALGGPPPVAVGSRFALAAGGSGSAVAARTALSAAVLGVLGVVGAASLAASLDRLLTSPPRYGSPGHAKVADVDDDIVAGFVNDRRVAAVLEVEVTELLVNGQLTPAITAHARKGSIDFRPLSGRLPTSPDEIALGPATLRRLGTGVGQLVAIGPPDRVRQATVVGEVLAIGVSLDEYDKTAIATQETFDQFRRNEPSRKVFFSWTPDVDRPAAVADIGRSVEIEELQTAPTRIAQLGQIRGLLSLLALFLGLLGLVALVHALLVTEQSHRRELAILRAMGFTRGQAIRTLASTATTLTAIGTVVGAPLGLIAANTVWRVLAASVDVATDLQPAVGTLVLALPAAAMVALLATVLPARKAVSARVAPILRAE